MAEAQAGKACVCMWMREKVILYLTVLLRNGLNRQLGGPFVLADHFSDAMAALSRLNDNSWVAVHNLFDGMARSGRGMKVALQSEIEVAQLGGDLCRVWQDGHHLWQCGVKGQLPFRAWRSIAEQAEGGNVTGSVTLRDRHAPLACPHTFLAWLPSCSAA